MSEEKDKEVEMLDEYDFSNGVIGKYAKQYAEVQIQTICEATGGRDGLLRLASAWHTRVEL